MADPASRTAALGKSFGPRQVLDQLSLEVPAGTMYGLLGPNGAGKPNTGLRHFFCRAASRGLPRSPWVPRDGVLAAAYIAWDGLIGGHTKRACEEVEFEAE